MRAAILAGRRAVTREVHSAEAEALCGHLPDIVGFGQTVCAYVPIKFEPGSITLLDTLVGLRKRVLLPVARSDDGVPLPMQWGQYLPGQLVPARLGLQEPQKPWLPAEAVADATVVLVPALAVDRAGVRLGRAQGSTTAPCRWRFRRPGWSRWSATRNSSTRSPPRRTTSR